jgi:hypothetical protein
MWINGIALTLCALFVAVFAPFSAEAAIPPCYYDLERNFFKSENVIKALSFQQLAITQSMWSGINSEIQRRASNIPALVKARASKMAQNPFAIPYQPEAAGAVFQSVLMDILASSLAQYNVTNPVTVAQIFDYLKQQQIVQWEACFVSDKEK